jgi:minor extracellular serine protease Vpr
MKINYTKISALFFFFLYSIFSFGQVVPTKPKSSEKYFVSEQKKVSKLSPETLSFLENYKKDEQNNLKNRIVNKSNIAYVNLFIVIEDDCVSYNLKEITPYYRKKTDNIYTALIPISIISDLENINCIKYVDTGEIMNSELFNVRELTNVDQVQSGIGLSQSYNGQGVIIGIIDEGIDYTHPTFKDLSGNLRITRVWEQNNTTGNPPANYNYGREYVGTAQILAKQYDINTESHGTHVSGIAAGSGSGTPSNLLRGIAPSSEIVIVSNGGTAVSNNDAVSYLLDYADSVNKPIVINMSFGTNLGPHDGSTINDTFFNYIANNNTGKSKILVKSAGNEGAKKTHIRKTLTSTDNTALSFVNFYTTNYPIVSSNGFGLLEIWGDIGSNFDFAVNVYNTNNNSFENYTPYINVNSNLSNQVFNLPDTDFFQPDNAVLTITTVASNPLNNRPYAKIIINNSAQDDSYKYILIEIRSNNSTVNSWCKQCDFSNLNRSNVVPGDNLFTITEPGNGSGIITVGAYNSNVLPEGAIADFSSRGPTVDLRLKPLITAPGNRITSSLNNFDANYQSGGAFWSDVNFAGVGNYYGLIEGTSMAAPAVSGIIALWQQAYPYLSFNDIVAIIGNNSITDSNTGTGTSIPNITWGYGKINALAGMQVIEQFLNLDNFDSTNNFVLYPNPTTSKIFVTSNEKYDNVEIYNTIGQKVFSQYLGTILNNQELDLSNLSQGTYIVKFNGELNIKSVKVIKQ